MSSVVLLCAEVTPASLNRIEKAILPAVAIALVVAIAATVASGIIHRERRITCGEGMEDCISYHNYGWPWQWRTSMPDDRLDRQIQNSDGGFFSINEDGYSVGWLLSTVSVWFTIALALEAVAGLTAWVVSRLLIEQGGASSG